MDDKFRLLTDVTRTLDDKEHVYGLSLDLSKNFYVVDHQMLLDKLEFLGMRDNPDKVLEWIRSYVVGRTQFVEIPFMDNSLCVNKAKTQWIDFVIRNYPPRDSIIILIGNLEISPITCKPTDYLGLVIENYLSWLGHINKVIKKLSDSIFLLTRKILICY